MASSVSLSPVPRVRCFTSYTSNSAVDLPMQIKLHFTLADYQSTYQTMKNGVYRKPCASNLSRVLLSDLVEDMISSLNEKDVQFVRAQQCPTKSRNVGYIDHGILGQ